MATFPIPRPPRRKIAKRQLDLRNRLWPDVTQDWLWSRHTHDGFTTLPKAMPLIMGIMDDLAKGEPVSLTYLELWCRTFDENFVTLSKPREIAFHSGFNGQRAERTWRTRLKLLAKLNFISLKEGASGPETYALLYNPYKVVQWHHDNKTRGLRIDKYNALMERALEIGDESLTPQPAPVVVAPTTVTPGVAPVAPIAPATTETPVAAPVAAPASS